MSMPYIVCLVPTRGDRPRMLEACINMMKGQTIFPIEVVLVNDPPLDPEKKDITWRYKKGLHDIVDRHPDVELILFIEDDDWYSPNYIEVFYDAWNRANRPDIFGISETYYYHIGTKSIYHQKHPKRASAFCTGISPDAISKIEWPSDCYSHIDFEMWKQLQGCTFSVQPPIAIGMKGHQEGQMFGGKGHNDSWNGYSTKDKDMMWISSMIRGKYSMDMMHFYFGEKSGPMGIVELLGPKK